MRPVRIAALAAIAASLLFGGVAFARQAKDTRVTLPKDHQFTNSSRQLIAMSPDGKSIVYVANSRLYLKPVDGAQAVALPGSNVPEGLSDPVFSPDSKSIVFRSGADQTFRRLPIAGGNAILLATGSVPLGMSWGPDDQIVYSQRTPNVNGVVRISANGGTAETIVTLPQNEVAQGPQLLPGGDTVLFTLGTIPPNNTPAAQIWDNAKIVAQSIRSGERKILIQGGSDARYVPSGHIVYAAGEKLMAVRFDRTRLEVTGKPVAILEGVRRTATGTAQFSFSSTGAMIYLPLPPSEVRLAFVDLKGAEKQAGSLPASTFAPRLSPDDQQATFDAYDSGDMTFRIYVYDIRTRQLRKLMTPGQSSRFSMWSPDGKRIIYVSNPGAESWMYWQPADGSGTPERLLETARAPEFWSAANRFLSFITLDTSANVADYDISAYSFETRKTSPLIVTPRTAQHSSRLSPDGHWIAYISDETGRHEVFVQPFPITGEKFQVTRNGGGHPLWSPDGKQLYFDNGQRLFSVQIRTQPSFAASEPTALPVQGFLQAGGNNRRQYDITADGKQFLMMFPLAEDLHIITNWFEELNRLAR